MLHFLHKLEQLHNVAKCSICVASPGSYVILNDLRSPGAAPTTHYLDIHLPELRSKQIQKGKGYRLFLYLVLSTFYHIILFNAFNNYNYNDNN